MRRRVEQVNLRSTAGLTFLGAADAGETAGAAFVAWPDGRRSVVTLAMVPSASMRRTAEILEGLRAQGIPVPRHELVVDLGDDVVAVVQERLPGRPTERVDADVIDALVAANDRFAARLAGRSDVPIPRLYLDESGPAFPRHETLEQYSDRSRRLLRRIRAIGSREPNEMSGTDVVHPDFTVPNVLFAADGTISGIVDWNNGLHRGDRHFALVKLYFDLTWDASAPDGGRHRIQPSALTRLAGVLQSSTDPRTLQLYWAHWTLTMLHWVIRAGDTDVIDLHLRLGEQCLGDQGLE